MILIDTSVLSRALRRREPGPAEARIRVELDRLSEGRRPLGIPGVVLQEILSGIRGEEPLRQMEQALAACFELVRASLEDHFAAARLRGLCQGRGLNVSGIDCLIAQQAIASSAQLFAIDADFEAIAKVAPLKLYKPKA